MKDLGSAAGEVDDGLSGGGMDSVDRCSNAPFRHRKSRPLLLASSAAVLLPSTDGPQAAAITRYPAVLAAVIKCTLR